MPNIPKPDKVIIREVVEEWNTASGSIHVMAVTQRLDQLVIRHGDNVTIEGCCAALESMAEDALAIRDELKKTKEEQRKNNL